MKTGTRLQFSPYWTQVARAAGWVAVTMTLGLILVMLFGRPSTASTSSEPTSPGGHQIKSKTGPWVYRSASTPV
jgi:hypothetical protein